MVPAHCKGPRVSCSRVTWPAPPVHPHQLHLSSSNDFYCAKFATFEPFPRQPDTFPPQRKPNLTLHSSSALPHCLKMASSKLLLFALALPVLLGVVIVYLYPALLTYPSQLSFWSSKSCLKEGQIAFTKEQLALHDGKDATKGLYLAFLGRVYDVENGLRHYGPGGSYSHFAGRDGTRGFLTGDFSKEGLTDDITDLETTAMSGVREWIEFYEREYPQIGIVVGTYYDWAGCETEKLHKLRQKFAEYDALMAKKQSEEQEYPSCNSEWQQETGTTRLWCSPMSGGVKRDWAGVPRQIITKDDSRCGCVNVENENVGVQYEQDEDNSQKGPPHLSLETGGATIKEYPGCNPQATQCLLYDSEKEKLEL